MKSKIYGVVVVVYIILAGMYLIKSWEGEKEQYAADIVTQAETWAGEVDVVMVQKLAASISDKNAPEYNTLKEQLATWASTDEKIVFTYLMGRRYIAGKDEIFFFVDNVPHTDSNVSFPGDIYTEASQASHSVFTEGVTVIEGPLIDRWGMWMSASAPIRAENGAVVAALGIDYDLATYKQNLLIGMLAHLAGVFVLGIFFMYILARRRSALYRK